MGFRSDAEADNAARVMLDPVELDKRVTEMQMSPNSILAQQTIMSIISKIVASSDVGEAAGQPTTLNEIQSMLNAKNRARIRDAATAIGQSIASPPVPFP